MKLHIRSETFCKVVKKFNKTGKYAIDQVRVENKQSELRLKGELATRIEFDFLKKKLRAACKAFEGRLKAVVKNKGKKLNKCC